MDDVLRREETFRAIESLRQLSKQLRRSFSPELVEANDREVRRLSLWRASEVAHAFSLFFHLVNLCEERQRVRRLRVYENHEEGAPMSLRYTFAELSRVHVSPRALASLLRTLNQF